MTTVEEVTTPLPRHLSVRVQRFGLVSLGTASLGQGAILLLHAGWGVGAVLANALAACLVSVVCYLLCTRFVWSSNRARRYTVELPGFVASSLVGLALSTVTVTAATHVSSHPLLPNIASAVGFGLAWVVRFAALDRLVFVHGRWRASEPALP